MQRDRAERAALKLVREFAPDITWRFDQFSGRLLARISVHTGGHYVRERPKLVDFVDSSRPMRNAIHRETYIQPKSFVADMSWSFGELFDVTPDNVFLMHALLRPYESPPPEVTLSSQGLEMLLRSVEEMRHSIAEITAPQASKTAASESQDSPTAP